MVNQRLGICQGTFGEYLSAIRNLKQDRSQVIWTVSGCCGTFSLAEATLKLATVLPSQKIGNMNLDLSFVFKMIGRGTFFALTVTQGLLLASYPAKYTENDYWYGIALTLYSPSMILWLCLVLPKPSRLEANLSWSFGVWGLYIFPGLIPSIGIVFGGAGYLQSFNTTVNATHCDAPLRVSNETANLTLCDDLLRAANDLCDLLRAPVLTVNNDTKTLGPTLLKATLCVTPLLLLLLLNTASDANETDENKDDVYKLCVQLAVDLLDAVEMIDIVLDEKEHNYGISQGFGIAMIAVACISFLLSLWPMIETKLHGKKKTISAISRNAAEIVLVNGPFLVIRLVIVFSYGKDESIFVAKNVIAIILSVLEIRDELA